MRRISPVSILLGAVAVLYLRILYFGLQSLNGPALPNHQPKKLQPFIANPSNPTRSSPTSLTVSSTQQLPEPSYINNIILQASPDVFRNISRDSDCWVVSLFAQAITS